jgi:hypothetical protein
MKSIRQQRQASGKETSRNLSRGNYYVEEYRENQILFTGIMVMMRVIVMILFMRMVRCQKKSPVLERL